MAHSLTCCLVAGGMCTHPDCTIWKHLPLAENEHVTCDIYTDKYTMTLGKTMKSTRQTFDPANSYPSLCFTTGDCYVVSEATWIL